MWTCLWTPSLFSSNRHGTLFVNKKSSTFQIKWRWSLFSDVMNLRTKPWQMYSLRSNKSKIRLQTILLMISASDAVRLSTKPSASTNLSQSCTVRTSLRRSSKSWEKTSSPNFSTALTHSSRKSITRLTRSSLRRSRSCRLSLCRRLPVSSLPSARHWRKVVYPAMPGKSRPWWFKALKNGKGKSPCTRKTWSCRSIP